MQDLTIILVCWRSWDERFSTSPVAWSLQLRNFIFLLVLLVNLETKHHILGLGVEIHACQCFGWSSILARVALNLLIVQKKCACWSWSSMKASLDSGLSWTQHSRAVQSIEISGSVVKLPCQLGVHYDVCLDINKPFCLEVYGCEIYISGK